MQAEALKVHIANQQRPLTQTLELVVVSPLTRALETAIGAFGGTISTALGDEPHLMLPQEAIEGVRPARPGVSAAGVPPFVACELCREHLGVHPCDRRRNLSHYKARYPAVDWTNIESEKARRGAASAAWPARRWAPPAADMSVPARGRTHCGCQTCASRTSTWPSGPPPSCAGSWHGRSSTSLS